MYENGFYSVAASGLDEGPFDEVAVCGVAVRQRNVG